MINFDLVENGVFVGSAPQSNVDVERLKQLKITAVINLQSDEDLAVRNIDWPKMEASYQQHDLVVERFPINDFDETDLGNKVAEPIKRLNAFLSVGHKVYIHCNSGICRAPAVALGYLCHFQGMSMEAGLQQLWIARPVASPYRSAVKKALENDEISWSRYKSYLQILEGEDEHYRTDIWE